MRDSARTGPPFAPIRASDHAVVPGTRRLLGARGPTRVAASSARPPGGEEAHPALLARLRDGVDDAGDLLDQARRSSVWTTVARLLPSASDRDQTQLRPLFKQRQQAAGFRRQPAQRRRRAVAARWTTLRREAPGGQQGRAASKKEQQ